MEPEAGRNKVRWKRVKWTPEEDERLAASVKKGFTSWTSIAENAGLQRCRKSCRLRWNNFLKPDIKRGHFSLSEQITIIDLHSVLGNRWTEIATHLPNRTDSDIKNYWNTQTRKQLMLKMGRNPVTPTSSPLNLVAGQQFNDQLKVQSEVEAREPRSKLLHPGSSSTYASTGHVCTISRYLSRSEVEIHVPPIYQEPVMGEYHGKQPSCEEFPRSHSGTGMNNYSASGSAQGTNYGVAPNLLFPEYSFHDNLDFPGDKKWLPTDLAQQFLSPGPVCQPAGPSKPDYLTNVRNMLSYSYSVDKIL